MGQIAENVARVELAERGLGIGETHSKPDGRRFAVELLRERAVRALFLEGLQEQQAEFDQAVAKHKHDRDWYDQCAAAFGRVTDCPGCEIGLTVLAALAVTLDVPVFLLDIWIPTFKKTERGINFDRQHGLKLEKDNMSGVAMRDLYAARRFEKIIEKNFGNQKRGCLVLYGHGHFTGDWGNRQVSCLGSRLNLNYVLFT
jgi:hypothetical protein